MQCDNFRADDVGSGFDVTRDLNCVGVVIIGRYDIGPSSWENVLVMLYFYFLSTSHTCSTIIT
jgi:hypothetical protein